MAVEVKMQHTNITVGTAVDILDAPAAGKTRVVPPAGISIHNSHASISTSLELLMDDGGVERRIQTVATPLMKDTAVYNVAPIHLETTTQKLVIDNASGGIDLDVVVSFLEES